MRQMIFPLLFLILTGGNAFSSKIIKIPAFDRTILLGKLDLPPGPVKTLVIYVNGTGPNTYDNHRNIEGQVFNYFDLFAHEFNARNVAFYRYCTRGTTPSDKAPYFDTVDKAKYSSYLPENEVKDIESMITFLKKEPRLKQAQVVLLGWSEGTIIAPLVAERKNVPVAALLLAGYANENMKDLINWQLSGGSSMVFYRKYFDTDQDGLISPQEYKADPKKVISTVLGKTSFSNIDINHDGYIDSEDFKVILTNRNQQVFRAIETGDDDWIWSHFFRVTSLWAREHFKLRANKDLLPELDLPIYILQGIEDMNVPYEGALDIEERFKQAGKHNLKVFLFKNHDHDLNYMLFPIKGEIPEGIQKIFDVVESIDKGTEIKD